MFVLKHPQEIENVKYHLRGFLNLLHLILILNNIPMGDMGSLCPSYAFSFSSLLLKILLLRVTDTLSIAAPNRMVNC